MKECVIKIFIKNHGHQHMQDYSLSLFSLSRSLFFVLYTTILVARWIKFLILSDPILSVKQDKL